MFVRYFVELPLPPDTVVNALGEGGASLGRLATSSNHRGDVLIAEVGVGDAVRIARRVELEVGEPVRMGTVTALPLRWVASGPHGLFPSLDADLEVAPLPDGRSQLAISARYEPPLGVLGRAIDRVVLHRVAEATVKDFLDRVREAVLRGATAEASGGSTGTGR
jgi:hypothetical protein